MSKKYEIDKKKHDTYIYYDANGNRIVELISGKDGVTQAFIEELHSMDDAWVCEQRYADNHTPIHFEAFCGTDVENYEDSGDFDGYLSDDRFNPEYLLIAAEDDAAYQDRLPQLGKAMDSLPPKQKELFTKVYVERRSFTDIAAEEGMSEVAIRSRLKRMHDRLRKLLG